ncbi:MAG: translation initiation factor IF-6 [Euryarchaeota archaeon]|nr:translation initiation factor IF-6 [Euryarchaeota archaeon]
MDFDGNPNIGIFARATDTRVLLPPGISPRARRHIEESLQVPALEATIGDSPVLGALIAANSRGLLVANIADDAEISRLAADGLHVARLPGRLNAAGNLVLANDTAAILSPRLPDRAAQVASETLGVDVHRTTIAGLHNPGMAAFATNKGVLVHPRTTPQEIAILEKAFQLPLDIGTVNGGYPYIGSAVLANTHGYIAGTHTTGPELGRIEDALGFL